MASVTRAALRVQTSGRYRPVASAKPAMAPVGSCTGRSLVANTVPDVPIGHGHLAGAQSGPQGSGHVVPGAGGDRRARPAVRARPAAAGGEGAGLLPRTEHSRERGRPVHPGSDQSPAGRSGSGPRSGTSSRYRRRRRDRSRTAPVRRKVSQSWGSRRWPILANVPARTGEPGQLGNGEGGHRHAPAGIGPAGRRRAGRRAGRRPRPIPCRSTAWPGGARTATGRGRPARAAGRPRRPRPRRSARRSRSAADEGPGHGLDQCGPPHPRVPARCAGGWSAGWTARPAPITRPVARSRSSTLVDCVDESTPATSGMRRRYRRAQSGGATRALARRHRSVPGRAGLGVAVEGLRVDAVESELGPESEGPLEVVEEAPHEIAADVHTVVEGAPYAAQDLGQVDGALGVVVGGDAALGQQHRHARRWPRPAGRSARLLAASTRIPSG